MRACLAQNDVVEAKRWHTDIFAYKEHLAIVHASLRALEKQLVKLGLATLHKETMELMKDSAKHMYKQASGTVTAENAIMYTDALADVHVENTEVGNILTHEETADNSAADDDWATIMQQHSAHENVATDTLEATSDTSDARGSPGNEGLPVGLPSVPTIQPTPAARRANGQSEAVSCVL